MPNKLNEEMYDKDHEKAYLEACKVFFPAINEADEVWIYAPDGIGEHTRRDINYALSHQKIVRVIGEPI